MPPQGTRLRWVDRPVRLSDFQKLPRRHPQAPGETLQRLEARVDASPLEAPHEGAMNFDERREALLGEASVRSERTDDVAQPHTEWHRRHEA